MSELVSSRSAPDRPNAGVAMCVYNGGRCLRIQLESIARRTEMPRHMVVVDDGSNDGSWELLNKRTAGFPVRLEQNAALAGLLQPQLPRQQQRLARLEEMRAYARRVEAARGVLECLYSAICQATHRTSLPRNPLRRVQAVQGEWRRGQYRPGPAAAHPCFTTC